jgi:signal transduction histidine kinase
MQHQMENQGTSNLLLNVNFDVLTIFHEYTDWHEALLKVFTLIGSHVDVDRIYYFEIHKDLISGEELTSQRFEWVKNGIEPMIDNPELQNLPIEIAKDFMDPLLVNKPFEAIIRELPEGYTKEILSSQSILSILVLPINISNRLYGFIGFDDCTRERQWKEDELNFLRTITSNLASAIYRRNALMEVESKATELERINKELEQFAFVASHDLQEPLRMVTSFLGLFEKKYANLVDDEGRTYIKYAVNGSASMSRIINDLLEYSRVGRTPSSLDEVNMADLVDELLDMYSNKISEKGAIFSFNDTLRLVTWKAPLQQVLLNLLDNALKYARQGVRPEVQLALQEQPGQWYFTFSDNGIGIHPQYHEKIFIIFQRLHSKDKYEGTGLGLAITKKIIEDLGGKIWVTSVPGEGSTFHFTLPKQTLVQ